MDRDDVRRTLQYFLEDRMKELTMPAPRRMFVTIGANDLVETCRLIREKLMINHLSTITGLDTGERLEALYHFATADLVLTVKVPLDRDHPILPTILDIFPAAVFYEREIHDLLGIHFEGHPDLRVLVLPEDWPEGIYPLRKDWKYNREEGVIK